MLQSKSKRFLSFEQLDSRIAMNGDVHPVVPISHGQPVVADFVLHFETRSVSFATFPLQRIVVQHVVLFKNNPEMKSRAEGESVSLAMANDAPHPTDQFGTESANSSAAIVQSNRIAVRSGSSQVIGSQDPPSQIRVTIPTPARELVPPASPSPLASTASRGASAAPPVDSSTTRVGSVAGLLSLQSTVMQSQSYTVRSSMAVVLEQSLQSGQTKVASKSEATKSMENGMLGFTLHQKVDRSVSLSARKEYRAENFNSNAGIREFKNHLPAPKGMIEIGGTLEVQSKHHQVSMVSMASNNPFEILQLFIGSTNMVSNVSRTLEHNASWTLGCDTESDESTELATREDSILALAIGVAFVIAGRQSKILHTSERPPSLPIRRTPLT